MARILLKSQYVMWCRSPKDFTKMYRVIPDLCGLLLICACSLCGLAMGSYLLGDAGSLLGLTAGGLWGLHVAESCAFLLKPQHWRNEEAPEKGYAAMFSESKGTSLPASKRPWLSRILGIKSDKPAPPESYDSYSLEEIHRRLKEINSQVWRELRTGVLSSCHAGLYSVRLDYVGQRLDWREVNRLTVSALHRFETATSDEDRRNSLKEALDRIGQKLQLVKKAALRKADRLSVEEEREIQKNEAELWRLSRLDRLSTS
jgi:hypothetical protein